MLHLSMEEYQDKRFKRIYINYGTKLQKGYNCILKIFLLSI